MSKKTVTYYFHDRDVGITRRFISFHGVVRLVLSNGYIYYFHDLDVGITRRFISCHDVVRLVLSNGYILFPWP